MSLIATTAYSTLELELLDGTTVELRPLTIKGLKTFMSKIDELAGNAEQNKFMDICLEAAIIALAKQRPDFSGVKGRNLAEDTLDMDTVYKILDVCGGVRLNDPKLLAKATEILAEAQTGQP